MIGETRYRCLACGGEVLERTDWPEPGRIETTLEHVDLGDAACRLFMEAFADERAEAMRRLVERTTAAFRDGDHGA